MAKAASDKKALDIVIIDMRKVPGVCDFFVVASGTSTTQVKAVADHIMRKFREARQRLCHAEGEREALWILLDYGDVVGHIFCDETRRFYELERLWGDVPQERFPERPRRRAGGAKKRKRRV
jgi:ribosome-associated protein